MPRVNENIRKIFTKITRNCNEVQPIDIESFIGFLRQQSQWIKEHTEYERDMDHNLSANNKVLVRFSIQQYVTNFDNYFREKGLYAHKIEGVFFIMMNILAPPTEIAAMLSKENRKRLFSGVLSNLSLNTNIKLADLIKTYYGMINTVPEPFNQQTKDSLLEVYKESIELVDKYYDNLSAKNVTSGQSPTLTEAPKLLTELLKAFSIQTRADLLKVLTKANILGFSFSVLVYSLIIILMLVFYNQIEQSIAGVVEFQSIPIITNAIITILILFFIVNIVSFTRNRMKKKYLLRTLRSFIRHFNISHNVLDAYFRGKFDFDIRKLH